MKHSINHDLDLALAKRATQKAFDGYMKRFEEYEPRADWVTDTRAEISFSAKGMKLDGVVELKPDVIDLELNVPFIFRIFSKKAMSIIEEEISEWVAKAKAGELDE